jgi:hypothetical protein
MVREVAYTIGHWFSWVSLLVSVITFLIFQEHFENLHIGCQAKLQERKNRLCQSRRPNEIEKVNFTLMGFLSALYTLVQDDMGLWGQAPW